MPLPLRSAAPFFALAALAACATPQDRCINAATRDMGIVDQLIAETEGNLQRGYALQPETVYHTEFQDCTPTATAQYPNPAPRMCPVEVPSTTNRAVAVDLSLEKAKLSSLRAKRDQQGKRAHSAIAECRARYPE